MKIINKLRLCYHLKQAEIALRKGKKSKYEKHARKTYKVLWNATNEPKFK